MASAIEIGDLIAFQMLSYTIAATEQIYLQKFVWKSDECQFELWRWNTCLVQLV